MAREHHRNRRRAGRAAEQLAQLRRHRGLELVEHRIREQRAAAPSMRFGRDLREEIHGRRAPGRLHDAGPIFADGVTPTPGDACGLGHALTVVTPLIAGPCTSKCSVGVQPRLLLITMSATTRMRRGCRPCRFAEDDPPRELREKLSEGITHDRNNVTG